MTEFPIAYQRKIIARLVFSYILVFLIYRFFINATPSNLLGPPLKVLNFDFTYWVYQLLNLQGGIIYNQTGGVVFDIVLFASCILCILFPLKNGFPIIFGILFFIYAITYNTYIVSHSHPLAVTMLITIPFCFTQDKYWKILWEGMRYYICYIYTISFVWKVFIGKSFFFWDQGINSIKLNLVEYMYHFPATTASSVYKYLITHPYLLNIGHLLIVLLEGIMVIGFFTKKYDRQLMIVPVLIHGATYFASDVFFMEMLVGVFVFLSRKNMVAINKKLSFITR